MERTWSTMVSIPAYLIQGIGDSGMSEVYDENVLVDKDDLRICIELSGGMNMVLDGNLRMVVTNEGIDIQVK